MTILDKVHLHLVDKPTNLIAIVTPVVITNLNIGTTILNLKICGSKYLFFPRRVRTHAIVILRQQRLQCVQHVRPLSHLD